MGLETGSRTFDNIDIILFPIVLLLRASPLVLALAKFIPKLVLLVYSYLFK
jgi:hypothetical protein